MLTHDQIWSAIDRLAQRCGLTASSLARLAGLDPTTFNRSKRVSADGNARWPSTESIAKILAATNVSVDEFLSLIPKSEAPKAPGPPFRQIDLSLAAAFDAKGSPFGESWETLSAPGFGDDGVFALGIVGDAYSPTYNDGDILLLSANIQPRRGDRILIVETSGDIIIASLGQMTASSLHIKALDGTALPTRKRSSIALMARILWVSQ